MTPDEAIEKARWYGREDIATTLREEANVLADEVERLRERVGVLESILVTPKTDANDDPLLTCVICGAENCDAYFTTHGGGESGAFGIHVACRRAALKGST